MAKNKSAGANVAAGKVKSPAELFQERVRELKSKGMVPIVPTDIPPCEEISNGPMDICEGNAIGGRAIRGTFGMFDGKQSRPITVDGAGTPKLGYIPWGSSDRLPNDIFTLASSLPYTAAALKYITDLTVGYGPSLMYPVVRYSRGALMYDYIPYGLAGDLLLGKIADVRALIEEQKRNEKETAGEKSAGDDPVASFEDTPLMQQMGREPEVGSLEYDLKRLLEDYEVWKQTNEEVSRFLENNNLLLHYMKCMTDDVHMDIYFPTVGLSIGKRDEEWEPKIVKIGNLPAVCARLEEMDERFRINYVYYSERWRSDATVALEQKDIVAYPALMPGNMLPELRRQVERGKKMPLRKRPTWFCCPIFYPSMSKPYYPQPAWWSIFPSSVYEYASTLMVDKATARRNATMWGKMIFVNQEYLRSLFDAMGADTKEAQQEIKNKLYADVNNFLRRRENHGKTIMLDCFPDVQGKIQKSVEIVDVPQSSINAELKDETESITATIFFALSVHPALVGAIPGRSGSSGGTFQRELHLLKQSQMSPRQRNYQHWLQNIHTFNKWDKKAVWMIRQPVLTTLDRNATGIEETNTTE